MNAHEEIMNNLLLKIEQLEAVIEEKDTLIIMMEHDQQKLIEAINNICRETIL